MVEQQGGRRGVDLTKPHLPTASVSLRKPADPVPMAPSASPAQSQALERRSRVGLLIGAAVAVFVLLAGAAVAVSVLRGSHAQDAASGRPSAGAAGTSTQPSAAGTPSNAETPGTGAAGSPESKTARSVAGLLADSVRSRALVVAAGQALASCSGTDQTVAAFEQAASDRRSLVSRARSIDTSPLPGAAPALSALEQAWTLSARADDAFAESARSGPCGDPAATHIGTDLSTQTHPFKARAAALWNSIAPAYGLPTVDGLVL